MNIKLDLLDYNNLPIGETTQGCCPSCGKNKFYVTRKRDGIAYICFRDSCHTQGYVGVRSEAPSVTTSKPHYQFTGVLRYPTQQTVDWFSVRWQIDLGEYPEPGYWVKETDDGRYAFPLWGRMDEPRGVVIREPTWDRGHWSRAPIYREGGGYSGPKSRTYLETPTTVRAGWYHSLREDIVVIVEDQVSAMRITELGLTGYAILGTHLNQEHINDLMQWKNGKRYILALDPDAIQTSLRHMRRWHGSIPLTVASSLKYDPKDYECNYELRKDLGLL
jgi:hypothetical protein